MRGRERKKKKKEREERVLNEEREKEKKLVHLSNPFRYCLCVSKFIRFRTTHENDYLVFNMLNTKYLIFDTFEILLRHSKTKRNNNNNNKVCALIQPVL